MYLILDENKKVVGVSPIQDKNTVEVTELKPLLENEEAYWNGKELEYKFNTDEQIEVPEVDTKFTSTQIMGDLKNTIRPLTGDETREHTHEVSVLIPCYNQSALVKEAINSCLNQTQKPTNIIVLLMDTESYKLKKELEENPIIKCYKEKQMNVCKARTYLVEKCPTDWFVFLDADDMLGETFIETLDKSDGAICFSNCADLEDKLYEEIEMRNVSKESPIKAVTRNLTCLMHKDVFNEYGLDEEFCKGGEDADFILKVLENKKFKLTVSPETYYIYRRGNEHSQLTKNSDAFLESHNKMFEKHLPFFIKELDALHHKYCNTYNFLWLCKNWNADGKRKWINHKANHANKLVSDYTIFRIKLANYYNQLLDESKKRKAKSVYDREKFIQVGKEFFFNDIHLNGRSVDVIFYDCNNVYDINKFFTEEKRMLINEEVYNDLKKQNLSPVEEVFYLLENYNCFEETFGKQTPQDLSFTEETELKIRETKLPKEIKNHFLEYTGARDNFFICSSPAKKTIVFKFHSLCNQHCEYCFQKHHKQVVSDEEIYKNFDEALTKCEEKFGVENIFPQIMGGEPTIYSEWLQKKIIERVKNYREVLLFTNGTVPTSIFFNQPNFIFETHLLNWKGKVYSDCIPKNQSEFYIIIVKDNEIKDLENFAQGDNSFSKLVLPSPSNIEYEDEKKMLEYYKKINDISMEKFPNEFLEGYLRDYNEKGITAIRTNCRENTSAYSFNCETRTVSLCPQDKEQVPFEEFDFTQRPSHTSCENCFNLCSYYIR